MICNMSIKLNKQIKLHESINSIRNRFILSSSFQETLINIEIIFLKLLIEHNIEYPDLFFSDDGTIKGYLRRGDTQYTYVFKEDGEASLTEFYINTYAINTSVYEFSCKSSGIDASINKLVKILKHNCELGLKNE